MSPNNQNEYEIKDATPSTSVSSDSARYPFANEPTNALQNMNYKEYLRMSEGHDAAYFSNPEAFVDTKSIQAIINVIGKALGALGVPGAGIIASFYSFIVGQLWPSNSVSLWEQIMEQVEELIDQKITEYARNKALTELKGLGDALDVYQESLEAWLENRNDTRARSVVSKQFIALELDFVGAIPSFAVSNQEVPLLAVYAQAANLHLLLLRDASIFGADWGFSSSEISTYYNRQVRLTSQYSDYCVKWYNTGLDKLKGTNSASWLKYHQFRREMTLMVLDVVALFPNYNTQTYPIETRAQLTRDVYTDPAAFNIVSDYGFCNPWSTHSGILFSEVENAVIRSPHLFDILSSIEINTARGGIALNNTAYINYWSGHSLKYHETNNPTIRAVNYGRITSEKNSLVLEDRDIFETISVVANLANVYQKAYGVPESYFNMTRRGTSSTSSYLYSKTHTTPYGCSDVYPSYSDIPIDRNVPVAESYSHRLSHITFHSFSKNSNAIYGSFPVFVWTHVSADLTNTIYPDAITQLPMVKANALLSGTSVIKGPGSTGGDILRRTSVGRVGNFKVNVNGPLTQRYLVRIRYASTTDLDFYVYRGGTTVSNYRFNKTMNKGASLTYDIFKFASFSTPFTFTKTQDELGISIQNFSSGEEVYIDRIEVIPVGTTYEAETDLEIAKRAVNTLFTNTKDGLRPGVTDYEVNQAANLVECLSDDLYPNEKRLLFDAVKEAKRLSGVRNLLQDSDFQEINGENGWTGSTGSTGIEIVEGDALFKGRYLRLPGAPEIDTETYPTYLYQKIDEGLLKPYTRYRLRGFVGSSQGLEIYTIRHQTNRIVKNVPDDLLPDVSLVSAGDGINRCSEQKYVNSRLEGERGLPNGNRSADAHEFSIQIDTGEIDLNGNEGIWVGFKVATPDGYATLGNLELVEEGPLSGDALERVQREEQQWKIRMTKRREETDRKYTAAKQAVDRLYADYQDQQLNPNVEITDITAAQNLIQSIPYVYNDVFPGLPGMNYAKYTELTNRLQQAWSLYEQRNVIPNGDFRNELNNWNTTSGVNVQQINDRSVLVIPNWDEQVSQQFTVQPNQRYVLRVTARKEGVGNGYVSIRDGGNQTETLTFSANEYDTNGVYNDQIGYITKTVAFIPYTDQVWMDISETEGVLYIEGVKLVVDVE
nr:insecticidal delta-endotoxin Cry8Ea1 family protein [Brevibacillus laterosporus]